MRRFLFSARQGYRGNIARDFFSGQPPPILPRASLCRKPLGVGFRVKLQTGDRLGKIAGGPECARAFAADTRAERYSETARLWAEVGKSNIATSIDIRICPWRAKGGICFRARESLLFRDRAGRNPESQKRRNAFALRPLLLRKPASASDGLGLLPAFADFFCEFKRYSALLVEREGCGKFLLCAL